MIISALLKSHFISAQKLDFSNPSVEAISAVWWPFLDMEHVSWLWRLTLQRIEFLGCCKNPEGKQWRMNWRKRPNSILVLPLASRNFNCQNEGATMHNEKECSCLARLCIFIDQGDKFGDKRTTKAYLHSSSSETMNDPRVESERKWRLARHLPYGNGGLWCC